MHTLNQNMQALNTHPAPHANVVRTPRMAPHTQHISDFKLRQLFAALRQLFTPRQLFTLRQAFTPRQLFTSASAIYTASATCID